MRKVILGTSLLCILVAGCENQSPPKDSDGIQKSSVISKISKIPPAVIGNKTFELGAKCNMETLGGKPWSSILPIDQKKTLIITGWGVDDKRKLAPKAIFLRVQDEAANEFYVQAEPTSRPDVAGYFKEDYFTQSGYLVNVDVSDLPAATYDAMIIMDVSSKTILCSSGRKFVIAGVAK
jgi:hypothetical protein